MSDEEVLDDIFKDLVTPEIPAIQKRGRGRPRKDRSAPVPPVPVKDVEKDSGEGREEAKREEEPGPDKTGWPYFWPPGKAYPSRYVRQQIPCPRCRRLHLDNLSQAACCIATQPTPPPGVAYFRCRACEHRFKLSMGV